MLKKLTVLSVALVGVVTAIGCDTPGYSGKERGQMIARNWDMEYKMAQDDIDMALLLRPMTSLSRWNIR